ncbi:MAG: tRNA preQ1(34) S-adenosylmethionine ribosyltransferase-isomerase QueA [Phycisphaerales bacterium JB059]
MRTDELDYHLPAELIATRPCEPRDDARLLVCSRSTDRIEHLRVRDLPGLLGAGDTLVFNTTSVVRARFVGVNLETGGRVQGLYLRDASESEHGEPCWEAMLKARRFRPKRRVELLDHVGARTGVVLRLIERTGEEGGAWRVAVEGGAGPPSVALLEQAGRTPLPPYILSARRAQGLEIDDETDRASYQTVLADPERSGSVAAPTAGLHFTPRLLGALAQAGVERAEVELQVGAGTFKPVETETLEAHPMHAERCAMNAEALRQIFERATRVVAVGSTSARTIESYASIIERGASPPASLETDLLIAPGYAWRRVDALLTNFHLPRSTLLAMVSALFPEGMDRLRAIYAEAIERRYRFYSYGDAMLILP